MSYRYAEKGKMNLLPGTAVQIEKRE